MMTRRFLLVLLLLLTVPLIAGENYSAEFQKLYQAKDYPSALNLTHQWERAEPDNPQAPIQEANCYFAQGYRETVEFSQKTPTNGDFVLTNTQTKAKWVMGDKGQYDPAVCQKGIDILEQAAAKFPYRLDIWFGLAYMHNQLNQFPAMLDVLTRASAYASTHPEGLQMGNKAIPEPVNKFMPETMHQYCVQFSRSGNPDGLEKMFKVSRIMVQYFPRHSYGYDNLGGYYGSKKDWKDAKKYYETACQLAPDDPLEWMNLGTAYKDMGDKPNARKCYQKMITLNNNPDAVRDGKRLLAGLGQ
jgi:tetratricopeptide (TPR) repeat protein